MAAAITSCIPLAHNVHSLHRLCINFTVVCTCAFVTSASFKFLIKYSSTFNINAFLIPSIKDDLPAPGEPANIRAFGFVDCSKIILLNLITGYTLHINIRKVSEEAYYLRTEVGYFSEIGFKEGFSRSNKALT